MAARPMGGANRAGAKHFGFSGQKRFNFHNPFRVPRIYYKYRGFYQDGNTHETWVTSALLGPPPSGHALIDIVEVDSWEVVVSY